MASIDLGDQCLYCGQDTSYGSGRFVNRIPSFDVDYEQVHDSIQALNSSGTTFDGYYCADCQRADCEACQAEDAGQSWDPADYVGETGALCDEHAGLVPEE